MTNEQIIQLVEQYFTEEWCEENGNGWTEFAGKPDAFFGFTKKIREQTIDEILTALEEVPNPEANRTAISRIRGI